MTDLFLELLNRSIPAGWLVLAILVLRFVLRRAPRWIPVLLWGLVAIRLLCPISMESAISLIPDAAPITQETVAETIPVMGVDRPADGGDGANSQGGMKPVEMRQGLSSPQILSAVWLTGFTGMTAYSVVSYLRLRRRMATAVRLRDHIYQSEQVETPFVLGLIRPRIYLPFDVRERDFPHVLAHEQAHICRRDHWWKFLGFLLLALYWFHPLLWVAYFLLCRDIELACDERVIHTLSHEARADYSQALLACSVHHRSVAACPLAFGEVGVKARVRSILTYRKPAFWVVLAALAACGAAAVCFLTNPKGSGYDGSFGEIYRVDEVIYEDLRYSSVVAAPETAPIFALTADKELNICEDKVSQNWLHAGTLQEIPLTPETFDTDFQEEAWKEGSAKALRENNRAAWKVVVEDQRPNSVIYYLLEQKNGEMYLAFGYPYTSELSAADSPDAVTVRCVWKLVPGTLPDPEEQRAINALADSVRRADGHLLFTIPASYHAAQDWELRIAGTRRLSDGTTAAIHLFPDISKGRLWKAGTTYSIDLEEGGYTQLRMDVTLPKGTQASLDLLEQAPATEEAEAPGI